MKLNLGCGNKKIDGYINVDKYKTEAVDQVVDLEITPWPWNENTVDEILLIHVLEHMGQSTNSYLAIIQEIYRVSKSGAILKIHVPHPRSDDFIGDPTHVRAITPQSLMLFNRPLNDEWKQLKNSAATTLAHFLNVDIRIDSVINVLDPFWQNQLSSNKVTESDLDFLSRHQNNIISEWQISCKIYK